jgi:hypothetical protein
VHAAGDVETLTAHVRLVDEDRRLLHRLREAALANREQLTWEHGVRELEQIYAGLVTARHER